MISKIPKYKNINFKPVRLLLINGPLTSLFMATKIASISNNKEKLKTILLYEPRLYPKFYSENIKKNEKENKEYSLNIFGKQYDIFSLPPINYDYYSFTQLFKERKMLKLKTLPKPMRL